MQKLVSDFIKNNPNSSRNCFIIGATGEVGKCLVEETAKSGAFNKINILSRKPFFIDTSKYPNKDIFNNIVCDDFDQVCSSGKKNIFSENDFVFCSLGTTKSKAGSAEKFREIDHDLVIKLAQKSKEANTKWFGYVSAAGADVNSRFLYPQVKGEVERDLKEIGFVSLNIYRPGMLLCDRKESRPLERMGRFFAPMFDWASGGKAAISTQMVAQAMIIDAIQFNPSQKSQDQSCSIVSNKEMKEKVELIK